MVLFSPRKSVLPPKSVATADFHLTWPIDWVTDVEPAQACWANSLTLTKITGYFKRLDKCAALEPLIVCSSAAVQIQILQTIKTKIFSFAVNTKVGGDNLWCLWKRWPQTLMRLLNQRFQLHVAKGWKAGCGLNIPPSTITRGLTGLNAHPLRHDGITPDSPRELYWGFGNEGQAARERSPKKWVSGPAHNRQVSKS